MEIERAAFVFIAVLGIWILLAAVIVTLSTVEMSATSEKALPEPLIEEEWKLLDTSSSSGLNTAGSLD